MSSDVAKSPVKSNLEQKQLKALSTEANNEKSVTNGHSENISNENSSMTKTAENAETSSNSAKDKQKTSKSNKTSKKVDSKKDDTKNNHKSEETGTNDRNTSATPVKGKKNSDESEIGSEKIVNNDVVSDTSGLKPVQTESADNEIEEKPHEKKVGEDNNINSSNPTEISKTETNEISPKIKGNQNGENTADSEDHFNAKADEEMPSFSLEDEPDVGETKPKGKILKLKSSPLVEKPKASDKSKRKKKAKETVKQIEIEIEKPRLAAAVTHEPLRRPSSLSHISGRRSFRTLPELPTRRYHYEGPKTVKNDMDNSSSSLNVTVGSELAVDSSFSFFGFGKKREYTESVDTQSSKGETEETAKTPKRARLDRSGILNLIATPISLLRSQFSKTSMHCSTPNTKVQKVDEDGVENVSVVDAEELQTQKLPIEENIEDLKSEFKDGKLLDDDIGEDALQVQMQIENNQPDAKRKGCNVM